MAYCVLSRYVRDLPGALIQSALTMKTMKTMKTGVRRLFRALTFAGSARYWARRYAAGGTSGEGSYGDLAAFKAEIMNEFVAANHISSVIEFGCGDGNQLALMRYPCYAGFDVSHQAVSLCLKRFAMAGLDLLQEFGLLQRQNEFGRVQGIK